MALPRPKRSATRPMHNGMRLCARLKRLSMAPNLPFELCGQFPSTEDFL
jgi:hypothetical protein